MGRGKLMSTEIRVGEEFAGYRVESLLGQGGMGTVYLARHLRLERKVALKVLDPRLAADERFRERFLRESRVAAGMNHPNIVPLYDADRVGDVLFLAMRYVEGTDLGSILRHDGALAPRRAVDIVVQVASALDAAHSRGLIHRDVKPPNILIASGTGGEAPDHAYLSDFGLAKRPGSVAGLTKTGQFMGSMDYAAPEQFEGAQLTPRTDVYSLGCVLFECLTGEPPFVREQEAAVMYAHLHDPPPKPSALRPEIPPAMDAVVAKAMAKGPDHRHPTAGDLARAAREALPSREAQPGLPRPVRRRIIAPLVAGVLAIAVLAAGIVLLTRGNPAAGPRGGPTSAGGVVGPTTPAGLAFFSGVIRIDSSTDKVVKKIETRGEHLPLVEGFRSIAATRDSVWLGASGSKINPGANTVVATGLDGIESPMAADQETVWSWPFQAGLGWDRVVGVDARTNKQTHHIAITPDQTYVGGNPAIAVGSGSVWAEGGENGKNYVWRINPGTDTVVRPIGLPGLSPVAVAFGAGRFWFLDGLTGTARSIDPHTNRVSAPIGLPGTPSNLAAGAGALWVADESEGKVYKVQPGAGIQVVDVGNDPVALAVGDGAVWVVNRGDGTVMRIDPVGGTVLDTIHVARGGGCIRGQAGRCLGIFDIAVGAGGVWVVESAGL
jgi:tRNA A-37 threonylcarbamoyl transferase component Bud32/streptogramin lyase